MGDLAPGHRPDLRCFKRDHRRGVSVQRHEFHFVALAITIHVDHRAHVATLQPLPPPGVRIRPSTIYFVPCADATLLAEAQLSAKSRNAVASARQLSLWKPSAT